MKLLLRNVRLPLTDFALEVSVELHGRVTAVFGPSGAGKTSLLDLVAGLRRAKSAFIQLDDRVLTDAEQGIFVPTRHRGIGYVPQDLALFPHLSVRQNLLYGHNPNEAAHGLFRFEHIVDVLEIQPLVQRGVAQLSGGERQRVALARALLTSPRLLLLDEPLASLDLKLKARILPYLTRIRDELRVPMLYVTHDRFEALTMADDVLVLMNGKVAQTGGVQEVFNRPTNPEVAGFLTVETILPGRIRRIQDGLVQVTVGSATVVAADQSLSSDASEVFVCIRAEDVIVLKGNDPASSARNHLRGTVHAISRDGPMRRVEIECGFRLAALLTRQACEELGLRPGDRVVALVKAPHIHLIPR